MAFSAEAAKREKAETIKNYMANKTREGGFRTEISKLLYDYIDYGNAFATPTFEARNKLLKDDTMVQGYTGPKAVRISPLDVVFNPLAASFQDSHKIIRSVKTIGELMLMVENMPDQEFWQAALDRRQGLNQLAGGTSAEDFEKATAYTVDGFGSLQEYYMGENVEILEFYGDYRDIATGQLHTNMVVTVVDRSIVVRLEPMETWFVGAPIYHVGWRLRPDNLWAMGPLDNLVGMQYRLDHLENIKADAKDLLINPPLAITGDVEEFVWGPNEEIHLDEGGSISEVTKSLQGIISAQNEMEMLEQRMEMFAGAPREAMGIRTAGEKTLGEVMQLAGASGRIFQEKITHFEIELCEKLLNGMLETARRNMNESDTISSIDDDLGATAFRTITKEDITANGVLRPVGARHFAKQAQDLQNLITIFNSPLGAKLEPHISGKELTKFVEDITGLSGYKIFQPNVALFEQQETQGLANQANEDLEVQASQPAEGSIEGEL